MKKIVYLGCPYSHPDISVRTERFDEVTRVAGRLIRAGHIVFSPITHGHPIQLAALGRLPTDWEYWERHCRAFLEVSSEMLVLMLTGWKESVGLQAEIEIAKELDIPIRYIKPGE